MLIFGGCLVAVVGYIAGTRENQLLEAVAPVFGFHVETGTIDLSSVQQTYQNLKANYDGTLNMDDLVAGANRGLVAAAGDKYTVYMDKRESSAFNDDLSGTVGGGIGAEIGVRSGEPVIVKILPDNPATTSGLKANDVVVAVNGESTKGWSAVRTANVIRGDVGTTVKITVNRDGKLHNYSITRATVNNPSVQSEVKNGVGILTITRFDEQTGALARKAAQSFRQQHVHGVVLDLRSDGGGYLQSAPEVAGLWLDDKLVVTERSKGKIIEQLHSGTDPTLRGLKTVVLVDGGTASASEIVAAALKDYGVVKLVGEKTYGKGTVQKIITGLNNGATLKVTIARWYPPKSGNVTGKGITPDITVKTTKDDINGGSDPQMAAAMRQLK